MLIVAGRALGVVGIEWQVASLLKISKPPAPIISGGRANERTACGYLLFVLFT